MEQKECALVKHQKIVLATDGSKHSEAALAQALSFASSCNSSLIIVHAIDLNPEYLALRPMFSEKMEKDAAAILDQAKQKAAAAGVRCETVLNTADQPYQAIVETAKKSNADLIVMGTHGWNALEKLVMGSVTRQVIGHAPCAVLVVPA